MMKDVIASGQNYAFYRNLGLKTGTALATGSVAARSASAKAAKL